jgi:hypothetical protein
METKRKTSKKTKILGGVAAGSLLLLAAYLSRRKPDSLASFHKTVSDRAKIQKYFFFDKTVGKRKLYNQFASSDAIAKRIAQTLPKPKIRPYVGDIGNLGMEEAFGFNWV